MKEIIAKAINIPIRDITDFKVDRYSQQLKLHSHHSRPDFVSRNLNNIDQIEISYSLNISNSLYNISYYISTLKNVVDTGQFIDNLHSYFQQYNFNISTFKDIASVRIFFSSEQIPTPQPIMIISRLPTIYNSNIPMIIDYLTTSPTILSSTIIPSVLNASPQPSTIIPSLYPTNMPSTSTKSFYPTIQPTQYISVIPSIYKSFTPSIHSTSRTPVIKPSYPPTYTRSLVPSVKPGDPTFAPTGKIR